MLRCDTYPWHLCVLGRQCVWPADTISLDSVRWMPQLVCGAGSWKSNKWVGGDRKLLEPIFTRWADGLLQVGTVGAAPTSAAPRRHSECRVALGKAGRLVILRGSGTHRGRI